MGTLTPATLATNPASPLPASNASYTEVGYLCLAQGAFYDSTFSLVDSATGDCIVNSTSEALSGGRFGCNVDTVVTQGCAAGAFTYSAQPAPGANNAGWADLTLNLGAAAVASAGVQCTAVGGTGPADTPANLSWLHGAGVSNPKARALFGVFRSPLIYLRENY